MFVNLGALTYWSMLRNVDLMIGNSSSGIMETPSFALPTVNVGIRQQGRERARNILDAAPEKLDILAKVAIARSEPIPPLAGRNAKSLRRWTRFREDRERTDVGAVGRGITRQEGDERAAGLAMREQDGG